MVAGLLVTASFVVEKAPKSWKCCEKAHFKKVLGTTMEEWELEKI
jgi:hypothetical protein